MNARDADRHGPEVTGTGPGGVDVIESGPDRAPRRVSVGVALVLAVVAALGGYLFGSRHQVGAVTPPAPSPSPPLAGQPIATTGKRCSVQLQDRLQLGIEIVNQSAAAMTLRRTGPVLPLHGLRARAATWGGCGQLSPAGSGESYPLAAGATTWLTITFDVLVACPAPIPVQFTVDYTQAGGSGTADLPGFNDLGDVPYSGSKCTP